MASQFLGIFSLLVSLFLNVTAYATAEAYADPLWDPTIDLNNTNPLAENALKIGLFCLDQDGQILTAGTMACAAAEIDSKIPVQLAINGKLVWTPQGDAAYRKAWKTMKTVSPNNPVSLRKDTSKPLAYNNARCSSGLCVHTSGSQKAYACFESRKALTWRKALGRLKSYAIEYKTYQPRQ